jgi:hypothetical protein
MAIQKNVLIAKKKIFIGNVRENLRMSGMVRWAPVHFVEYSNPPMIYFPQDLSIVKRGIVGVVSTRWFENSC